MKYNLLNDVKPFLEEHAKRSEPGEPIRYWHPLVTAFLWEQYKDKSFPNVDFSVDVHDLQDVQFVLTRRYFTQDDENIFYDVYNYYTEEHVFVLHFCRNLLELFFKRIPPIIYLSKFKNERSVNAEV